MINWKRLARVTLMTGSGWFLVLAWFLIPGADLASLLRMAAFVVGLPWIVTSVAYGPRALFGAVAAAGRRDADPGRVSARVVHTLGGLTWAAGLLGVYGTCYLARTTSIRVVASFPAPSAYALPLALISAMLVPPAFALIVRLTLYDPLARALEGRDEKAGQAPPTPESTGS